MRRIRSIQDLVELVVCAALGGATVGFLLPVFVWLFRQQGWIR